MAKREADSFDCMWALAGVFPKRYKRRKPQWTSPSFPLLSPPQITAQGPVLAKPTFPGGFFVQITPLLNSDKTHSNSQSICMWCICIQGHSSQTCTCEMQCKMSEKPLNPKSPESPCILHYKSCYVKNHHLCNGEWQAYNTLLRTSPQRWPCPLAQNTHKPRHFCYAQADPESRSF